MRLLLAGENVRDDFSLLIADVRGPSDSRIECVFALVVHFVALPPSSSTKTQQYSQAPDIVHCKHSGDPCKIIFDAARL